MEEILAWHLLNLPWLDWDVKVAGQEIAHIGAARDGMKFDLAQLE